MEDSATELARNDACVATVLTYLVRNGRLGGRQQELYTDTIR